MKDVLLLLLGSIPRLFRPRAALEAEILALRHQLLVMQRTSRRPQITAGDRLFWSWLSRIWLGWRDALVFVQPETVIAWRKRKFREHWTKLSQRKGPGRPPIAREVRELIRRISELNPDWGSPHIVGELGKLGIEVAKSTVEKYMVRRSGPRSQGWMTFLRNHLRDLVSVDFLVVPTARFKILFALVVLVHVRRRVVHINVTENPTAPWVAQQIVEAFPWDDAPAFLLRDRDGVYGTEFRRRVKHLGIKEILSAPRSPWQNPYVERMIGSIRRECLDKVIVLNERHVRTVLKAYLKYYHSWRTHMALDQDCPEPRLIQPREVGGVIAVPDVGGLNHHFERRAA